MYENVKTFSVAPIKSIGLIIKLNEINAGNNAEEKRLVAAEKIRAGGIRSKFDDGTRGHCFTQPIYQTRAADAKFLRKQLVMIKLEI